MTNDLVNNDRSLQQLAWAIDASVGQFKLILARCNYASLRDRLIKRLQEICQAEICVLEVQQSDKTLYTAIRDEFGAEILGCVMVIGLEKVQDLAVMLSSANQVREEFRQHFHFPLVLWIDDEIYKQLIQVAPDLESWAVTKNFPIDRQQLTDFILETAHQYLSDQTKLTFHESLKLETELLAAQRDLFIDGQIDNIELAANLLSLLGLINKNINKVTDALLYYHRAGDLWQKLDLIKPQEFILLEIAFCYYIQSYKYQDINHISWHNTRRYTQAYIDFINQIQRADLIAKSLYKLAIILRNLNDWEQLEKLSQKALIIHQADNNNREIARNYACLADVALAEKNWRQANQLINQALDFISADKSDNPLSAPELSLYRFIQGCSQYNLGQIPQAIANLEDAINKLNPQEDVRLYLHILSYLHNVYFTQKKYLAAYEIKQQLLSIEQQFGLRAFIGAGRLEARKQTHLETLPTTSLQDNIALEIAASGRQLDVERLIERVGRPDYKLIVIHGQSGVGKSSLINAGLVPALKKKAIGVQDNLVVVMRVYTNWLQELARILIKDGGKGEGETQRSSSEPIVSSFLIAQLRENEQRNLRTVLVFDQFEEFFFVYPELGQRKQFFEFLGECLHVLSVKVILSLRVDYIHYLLECNDLPEFQIIGNDILSNNVLYKLGNFSPNDTKSIIQRLTANTSFNLEPDLIDALVEDLAGELGEVRPIELQIVGAQLQTENITTLEKYRRFGTKQDLVQHYLNEVIHDCGEENQQLAEFLLYSLTDERGTRPLKTRGELERDFQQYFSAYDVESAQISPIPRQKQGKITPKSSQQPVRNEQILTLQQFDLVLDIFVKSGLVVLLPEKPTDRYQLVHDYLAAFIRQQQQQKLKQVIAELDKEREQRKLSEAKLYRFLQRALFSSVAVGIGIVVLTALAVQLANEAKKQTQNAEISAGINEINALNNSSEAFFVSKQYPDALIEALKAANKLKGTPWEREKSSATIQTAATLQRAIYLQPNEYKENRATEVNTLAGHENWVSSVAFAPQKRQLASGSGDKTVKIWDINNGQLLKTLSGHNDSVISIAHSPDGQQLASGSGDKTIKIWDISSGKSLKTLFGHRDSVISIAYSPDGQQLASASDDKTVKIWDINIGKSLKTLSGHNHAVRSVTYSPDGKQLASASRDKTVKIWDINSGQLLKTLSGHSDGVISIAYSPDGKHLASASSDKTIKIWDISNGQLLKTLSSHDQPVYSIAYSPNGQQLVSVSGDKTIKIWDVGSGQLLKTLSGHSNSVYSIAYSPDGKQLASASGDKTIKIWDISIGKPLKILYGHNDSVISIAYSPREKQLASGSGDNIIKIWDISTGQTLKTLSGHSDWVRSITYSPDGKQLASASSDKTIKIWDVSTGQPLKTLLGHQDRVISVAYSPDGQQLASASGDTTIKIWDVNSGQLLKTLFGHSSWVRSVTYSPDGKQLASASDDKTIKIWDVNNGKLLKTLSGHQNSVKSVVYSPDGKQLAAASDNIKIWDVSRGTPLKTLSGHSNWVRSVAYSPDGQQLASASRDNTIKIWDVNSGQVLKTLTGHSDWVRSIIYSPDGKQLATAGGDKTIIFWDLYFDNLLHSGCNLLNNYLIAHPQVLEELPSCQTPGR
ncbi:beta-propeller domain-containing protein [Nostoc parmelioides]|uniref:Intraflagellar transport protein 122 homolog n=1 Tax=Nostoc parmelioides FACHB-3921 TaxID=2692909 RepID=A0ABR8BL11_9NOSO|nr:ribosome assembly protein 4 [Nostoc parmelioides]MBD2253540.1 ribosome assembly protein 4 [Nostoc parmelioides FACHB-3921]